MRKTFCHKKNSTYGLHFFTRNKLISNSVNNINSSKDIIYKNEQSNNICETKKANIFKNTTKLGEKDINNNKNKLLLNNKEFTYVFCGDNKYIIKTRNKIINQKSKEIPNIDEKSLNNQKKSNNHINELQNNKRKIHRQLSSDILYDLNGKNFNNYNCISLKKNVSISSVKNSNEILPDIFPLGKKMEKSLYNLNISNNFFNNILIDNNSIRIEQLNQLHKNFINSIEDKSGFISYKDKINSFTNDKFNNLLLKSNCRNFFENNNNNNNKKWFNIKNDKIYEYNENKNIINDKKYNRIRKIERNSSDNNIFSKKRDNKNKELSKENNLKQLFDKKYERIKNDKIFKLNTSTKIKNSLSFKESNNIKKIKTKIKKYVEEKSQTLDRQESKDNSFSFNFSFNKHKNMNKKNNNNDIIQKDSQLNKINMLEKNNNFTTIFSSLNKNKNLSSNIFNFSFKNINFSYHSSKNMKIEEKPISKNNANNDLEDNKKKDAKNSNEENEQNQKGLFNFKTSSYFFSPNFNNEKKEMKETSSNIKEIINNVIENNKKVAQARASTNNFYNLGKLYSNNKMKESQRNFYSNSNFKKNFAEAEDNSNQKDKSNEGIEQNKRKSNSLKLTLLSPSEWKSHEELWINISKNMYNEKMEKFFLPPNDTDILISSYLKMYPNQLNICNYSKINSKSKNEDFLSFCIDDNIKNPKNEIIKWKKVYKILIFRWHPDKLFPILNELKIKNENIKNELQRRSSLIINNINSLYQKIIEILNKIIIYKDKNDNKGKK